MKSRRASRVQELFLRGAELPSEQRAAWLERVCGDDDELRRELASLLEHHREDTLFVDLPVSSEVRIDRTPTGGRTWRRWFEAPWRAVWICLAALALLTVTYTISVVRMERSVRERVGNGLQAVLAGYEQAMIHWIQAHEREVEVWGRDPELARLAKELVERGEELLLEGDEGRDKLRALEVHAQIRKVLEPLTTSDADLMYTVLNRSGFVLSSIERFFQQFGLHPDERIAAYVARIYQGEVRFVAPAFFDDWFVEPMPPELMKEASSWCNAPIVDDGRIVAVLGLGLPADRFDSIFDSEDLFESADIYAFNVEGVLVSDTRRADRLVPVEEAGPLPAWQRVRRVRDPGGDTTTGHVSSLAQEARPLTRLAETAINSRFDEDSKGGGRILEPYRNYLGVEVVGAWSWLDEYGIGIATEIGTAEAFEPISELRRGFAWLYLALGAGLVFTLGSAQRSVRARRAGAEGTKLGPYTLVRPIGEGGVGRVYLATHALLRRESAVKLLREDQLSDETRARFEREVQLASQLEHPNTIQIHDYGHTDDGTFYYAMEYVKGENLAQLVLRAGAMEPRRVVHVLRQVCGSLREAHDRGLVHRDIKPQNVMLGTRAGIPDVVKVLDFGLAKDLDASDEQDFTRMARITGTLLYMAPERIRDSRRSDRRVDIYAVGALAHFLLTGARMFDAENDLALVEQVLNAPPPPLASAAQGGPSPELARLVGRCLAKDPEQRPASMAELLAALEACPEAAARSAGADERAAWELARPAPVARPRGSPDSESRV